MALDVRQFARTVTLSEEQIRRQLRDCQRQGWALIIEHAPDASPQLSYWDRWGIPIHDPEDVDAVMHEIRGCRAAHPKHYIRVYACEAGRGQATIRHTLLVHSPENA